MFVSYEMRTGWPVDASTVAESAPPFPEPPPPLPFTVASKRTNRWRPGSCGANATCISTVLRLGSVMYSVSISYLPLFAVAVTLHAMPPESRTGSAVYVMSRVCRSVKVEPSVTTYCSVSRFVLSTVG